MWDDDNLKQQQAIGILGTNLIYGAFYLKELPDQLIESLLDNLDPNRIEVDPNRIEVDLIKFSGPDFEKINNRIMNLLLVHKGLTQAVLFSPEGKVELAANALYKKPVWLNAEVSAQSPKLTSICSNAPGLNSFKSLP